MSDRQALQEKFQRGLMDVLKDPSVEFEQDHPYKFLVYVVSSSFETMDEGERQSLVWEQVFRILNEFEQERIEYIYTESPSEVESHDPAGP